MSGWVPLDLSPPHPPTPVGVGQVLWVHTKVGASPSHSAPLPPPLPWLSPVEGSLKQGGSGRGRGPARAVKGGPEGGWTGWAKRLAAVTVASKCGWGVRLGRLGRRLTPHRKVWAGGPWSGQPGELPTPGPVSGTVCPWGVPGVAPMLKGPPPQPTKSTPCLDTLQDTRSAPSCSAEKFPFPACYRHSLPEIGQSKKNLGGNGVKLGNFWILGGKMGKFGAEMFCVCVGNRALRWGGGGGGTGGSSQGKTGGGGDGGKLGERGRKVGGEWVQMGLTAHAFPMCTPPHLHIELAPLGVHQETPAGCTRELCPAAEESMTPSQPPPPECLTFTYVPTSSPRSPHFPVAGRMGTSPAAWVGRQGPLGPVELLRMIPVLPAPCPCHGACARCCSDKRGGGGAYL